MAAWLAVDGVSRPADAASPGASAKCLNDGVYPSHQMERARNSRQGLLQVWNVRCDGVPHDIKVNLVILVSELVAHPSRVRDVQVGVLLLEVVREMVESLADHREPIARRVLQKLVR